MMDTLWDDHDCDGTWVEGKNWFTCSACRLVTTRNAMWFVDRKTALNLADPDGVQRKFLAACGLPVSRA